ncbi:MAG: DNA repair protein RecO [Candidatus Eutrophobiaceae bacterium]
MKVLLEPSYILHRRAWRESSLLLSIFSRNHGRVELLAKGAKRVKNRHFHLFSPWQSLRLSWITGRNLGVLTGIESDASIGLLESKCACCGFYLNELLLNLLHPDEADAELFDEYTCVLSALHEGSDFEIALRHFEKALLDSLGYGLILDHEVTHGAPLQADKTYWYVPNSGPQQTPAHSEGLLISGRTLLALAQRNLANEKKAIHTEAKHLMRLALAPHLTRSLASQDLYSQWHAVRQRETL